MELTSLLYDESLTCVCFLILGNKGIALLVAFILSQYNTDPEAPSALCVQTSS